MNSNKLQLDTVFPSRRFCLRRHRPQTRRAHRGDLDRDRGDVRVFDRAPVLQSVHRQPGIEARRNTYDPGA
jgi:hypothetical protein